MLLDIVINQFSLDALLQFRNDQLPRGHVIRKARVAHGLRGDAVGEPFLRIEYAFLVFSQLGNLRVFHQVDLRIGIPARI